MIDVSSARWLVDEIDDLLEEVTDEVGDISQIDRAKYKIEELRNELDSLEEDEDDVPDLTTYDLSGFKSNVIDSIPAKASLKFRMDVEEMLRRFEHVY
jgi:hypothetical protein